MPLERKSNPSSEPGMSLGIEGEETNENTEENRALNKYREIYHRIWDALKYNSTNGEEMIILKIENKEDTSINIVKNWNTTYKLKCSKQNGHFTLYYWQRLENIVEDVTPEELLDKILPNFEKRLNEWETLKAQERQRSIEDANQYAYQQDQQDANRLLQVNGLV